MPEIQKFIEDHGYPCEDHEYTTEDGYTNRILRIPGHDKEEFEKLGKRSKGRGRPVVIYQHGLTDSGFGLIADRYNSLGFKLVNMGFDLWLHNSRGNRYSNAHKDLEAPIDAIETDTKKEQNDKYWDFSFSEMAKYDQPALWKYV